MKRAKSKLPQEMDPYADLIEAKFQLPSIMKICASGNFRSVARLIIQPRGQKNAEKIITLMFGPAELKVRAVRAVSSSTVRRGLLLIDSQHIIAREKMISINDMFKFFMDCEELIARSRNSPSCSSSLQNGVAIRHRITDGNEVLDVHWLNPHSSNPEHLNQLTLLKAYKRLLRQAGLRDFGKDI